jgi:hypothetical protein
MNKRQKAEGSQPEPVQGSPSTVESLLGLSHPPPLYSQVERSSLTLDETSPVTSRKRKRNDTRSRREKSDSEANEEPAGIAASQGDSHARSSGRRRDDSVSRQVATVLPRLIRTKTLSVDIGKADCVPSSVLAEAFPSRTSDTCAQVTNVSSQKRVPNSQATGEISPSVSAERSSQFSEDSDLVSNEISCTNKHAFAVGSTTVTNTVDPALVSQNSQLSDLSAHKGKSESKREINPIASDERPLRSEKALIGDKTGCGLEPNTVETDKYHAVGSGDLGVLLADIGRLKALLVDDKESRRVDCLPDSNRKNCTGEPRHKEKGKSSRRSERGSSESENALVADRNLCRSEPESSTGSIILSESVSKLNALASDLLSTTNDLTSDKALLCKPSAQSTPKSSRTSDSCALSAEKSDQGALVTGDTCFLRSEIKTPETIVQQKNDQRLHESQPSLSTDDSLNPRHDSTVSPAGSERLNRSSNRADGQPEDRSNYWSSNHPADQTESSPRAADSSKSLSQVWPSPKTVELRPRLADCHGGERVESCTGATDSGETLQTGFKIAELGCETTTELSTLAEIVETSTQHLPNISESRAESPEDSNHVPHRREVVCGLSSQEGVDTCSPLSANALSPLAVSERFPVVPAGAVTRNPNEICTEISASNDSVTQRPMPVDLLSEIENTGVSGGECLVVTRDSIQSVSGTADSSIINLDVAESKTETLDPLRSIEFGKLGDHSEQAVVALAPELKTASTTCRIRVRQDMFQDPKEEPIRTCPVGEPSVQDLVKEKEEEEQDQVDRDRWTVEEDKKWLKRSVRDEDVLDTAGARSPPPRTLSRRLDYRRQRRHQWRSPVDGASQGTLSGVAPAKPKSGGQELITLNLNTESLDPEPPGLLLSDWQLSIQPLATLSSSPQPVVTSSSSCQLVVTPLMTSSSSQLMMTSPSSQAVIGSNYLSHKLKLRQPRLVPAQETSGGSESSASCSLPKGKRLFFCKFTLLQISAIYRRYWVP